MDIGSIRCNNDTLFVKRIKEMRMVKMGKIERLWHLVSRFGFLLFRTPYYMRRRVFSPLSKLFPLLFQCSIAQMDEMAANNTIEQSANGYTSEEPTMGNTISNETKTRRAIYYQL